MADAEWPVGGAMPDPCDVLLKAAEYAVQFSDRDINPTVRKRLQSAINYAKSNAFTAESDPR